MIARATKMTAGFKIGGAHRKSSVVDFGLGSPDSILCLIWSDTLCDGNQGCLHIQVKLGGTGVAFSPM